MSGKAADSSFGRIECSVVLCFALSGLSALMYQTAWTRLFSITFGTSDVAIAAVLAGYMGGLAIGSLAAGRIADQITRPVRVYALLEGGVAATVLLVPILLQLASWLYIQMAGDQSRPPGSGGPSQTAFYLSVTFVIVGLPTAMMGATLPIIARHLVRTKQQIGSRVGLIYGANTAGAVAGVALSAFYLLPAFGVSAVVWSAVCINALIFLVAMALPEHSCETHAADGAQQSDNVPGSAPPRPAAPGLFPRRSTKHYTEGADLILPVMLISGWVSFVCEILWTRLLGHVLGNGVYAFATMLATFLTGIAIGGALGGWSVRFFRRPAVTFAIAQVGIALSSAFTWFLLEHSVARYSGLIGPIGIAAAVMLPATLFIGATYPIAVRTLTEAPEHIGKQAARVYAWNTIGAIVGALSASLLLLPSLGFEGTIRIAVVTNLALALTVITFMVKPTLPAVVASAVLLLLATMFYAPERPHAATTSSAFDLMEWQDVHERFYAVGRASTVLLNENELAFELRTNGLPEAHISFQGALTFRSSQRWLGLLPVLARPDTRSMMIVGLGGGVVIEGIPPTVVDVDVVELEQEVAAANRQIHDRRTTDPLSQQRVNLVINDARNALRLTSKKYDAIVSQPSHPWISGAAHLFSNEFIGLAKQHLHDDGTLLIWMNATFLTPELLRSLAATIQTNFHYVRVYQVEPAVLHFLASDDPLNIEQQISATGRPLVDAASHYANNGILGAVDVAAMLLMDEQAVRNFSVGAELVTDDYNRMATASRSRGDGLYGQQLVDLLAPHDPLLHSTSEIRRTLNEMELVYISGRLLASDQRARVEKLLETLHTDGSRHIVLAMLAGLDKDSDSRKAHLLRAYQADETKMQAAWLLVQNSLDLLARGQADALTAEISEKMTGSAANVVHAWKTYRSGDWATLSDMDAELAQVSSTEFWYPRALELRVRWRLQTLNDSNISEAASMVERALSTSTDYELYSLRAQTARLQNDMPRYLESVIYASNAMHRRINRASAGIDPLSRDSVEELVSVVQQNLQFIDAGSLIGLDSRVASARKALDAIDDAVSDLQASLR